VNTTPLPSPSATAPLMPGTPGTYFPPLHTSDPPSEMVALLGERARVGTVTAPTELTGIVADVTKPYAFVEHCSTTIMYVGVPGHGSPKMASVTLMVHWSRPRQSPSTTDTDDFELHDALTAGGDVPSQPPEGVPNDANKTEVNDARAYASVTSHDRTIVSSQKGTDPHTLVFVAGASDVAHPAATNPTGESTEADAKDSMARTSAAGGVTLMDFQEGECVGSALRRPANVLKSARFRVSGQGARLLVTKVLLRHRSAFPTLHLHHAPALPNMT
jgi:hypothetical protein